MNQNINKKLLLLINESPILSDEEKKMWQEAVDGLPEKFANDILDYINIEVSAVRVLTDNLKEKVTAIKNKDVDSLMEILNREKQI